MIALDTNILARYLLNDDRAQADLAERVLFGKELCTAPVTVFLELVWVLESTDCSRSDIAQSLRLLFGIQNLKLQHLDALAYTVHWYENGMDFGDALHLALSAKESGFKTFDKSMIKKAKALHAFPEVAEPR
jgi:predicted nucleic-acid-binding protein